MLPAGRGLAVLRAAPVIILAVVGDAAAAQPVISGPAADRLLSWSLERRWSAGDEDDEFLVLDRIWDKDVAPGPGGSLFVVDRTANRVIQYAAEGTVVRTLVRLVVYGVRRGRD